MRQLIRVIASHDCWVADIDGDPGRTTIKKNAKVYRDKLGADYQCKRLKEKYPHRDFIVEPA